MSSPWVETNVDDDEKFVRRSLSPIGLKTSSMNVLHTLLT